MRKVLLIAMSLLLLVAAFAACQITHYDSPQTVQWDVPTPQTGYTIGTMEVALIPFNDDKLVPENYISLDDTLTVPEIYVDLGARGIYGRYVIAVRIQYDAAGVDIYWSDYGYSDQEEYVITVDGIPQLFTIQNLPNAPPMMIRIAAP